MLARCTQRLFCTSSRHIKPRRKKSGKDNKIDISPAWESIDFTTPSGLWMVVGDTDTGKSTFARYLYRRLLSQGVPAALLDGDPGQNSLGPPASMTLITGQARLHDPNRALDNFPPPFPLHELPIPTATWRSFIGDVSPRGHMLTMLVGAARLAGKAVEAGAQVTVYDTCGLVDPNQGGFALKEAKIELLHPVAIFTLQRDRELEPLIIPLQRSVKTRIIRLSPSAQVRTRSHPERQSHRSAQFRSYFEKASMISLNWRGLGVFPAPHFSLDMLVALEDRDGFTLGLGIVRDFDRSSGQLSLLTPLDTLAGVQALRLGNITLIL